MIAISFGNEYLGQLIFFLIDIIIDNWVLLYISKFINLVTLPLFRNVIRYILKFYLSYAVIQKFNLLYAIILKFHLLHAIILNFLFFCIHEDNKNDHTFKLRLSACKMCTQNAIEPYTALLPLLSVQLYYVLKSFRK